MWLVACPRGSYGENCASHCQCRSDAICDPVSGQCHCRMGFSGDQCDVPCDRNHFGPGCVESCNCMNGAACDPVTGCCDCTSGWYGQHCQLGMYHHHHHHLHHHHHRFWPAPLRLHNATRSQQPPEQAILSHIGCFSQSEIVGLEIISDCLHPCDPRASGWSLPISGGNAVRIFLASALSSSRTMCTN